jgi:hypothetical protein
MLNRIFLMSLLLAPAASWAACTSHKVGTLTLDCTAAGHELNNPATSGISLQIQSGKDKPKPPAAIRVVRPHETFDMEGPADKTTVNTSRETNTGPDMSGTDKPANKKSNVPKRMPE